jgi:hypothetical protein
MWIWYYYTSHKKNPPERRKTSLNFLTNILGLEGVIIMYLALKKDHGWQFLPGRVLQHARLNRVENEQLGHVRCLLETKDNRTKKKCTHTQKIKPWLKYVGELLPKNEHCWLFESGRISNVNHERRVARALGSFSTCVAQWTWTIFSSLLTNKSAMQSSQNSLSTVTAELQH